MRSKLENAWSNNSKNLATIVINQSMRTVLGLKSDGPCLKKPRGESLSFQPPTRNSRMARQLNLELSCPSSSQLRVGNVGVGVDNDNDALDLKNASRKWRISRNESPFFVTTLTTVTTMTAMMTTTTTTTAAAATRECLQKLEIASFLSQSKKGELRRRREKKTEHPSRRQPATGKVDLFRLFALQ